MNRPSLLLNAGESESKPGNDTLLASLLVLDVKLPDGVVINSEGDLFTQFSKITPKLLSYFMSFMTLGIYWTGHTTQYSFIYKSDRNPELDFNFLFNVHFIASIYYFLSERAY